MYDNITPEERLQRIAQLLVKAMYSYGDAGDYACGEETGDEEHPGEFEESERDGGASTQQQLPLSECDEFRSRSPVRTVGREGKDSLYRDRAQGYTICVVGRTP